MEALSEVLKFVKLDGQCSAMLSSRCPAVRVQLNGCDVTLVSLAKISAGDHPSAIDRGKRSCSARKDAGTLDFTKCRGHFDRSTRGWITLGKRSDRHTGGPFTSEQTSYISRSQKVTCMGAGGEETKFSCGYMSCQPHRKACWSKRCGAGLSSFHKEKQAGELAFVTRKSNLRALIHRKPAAP